MSRRIRELDGVRGIAILLVLVWHYVACQVPVEGPGAAPLVVRLLSLTWSGVDLFFVLSGFLIVGILLDTKKSPSYFKSFYIRRVCRIFPLYYLMVGLFVLLPRLGLFHNDWLFAAELPLWSYITLTQNFFMHEGGFGPNWLGVTWSLAVEEQFYLVIPLMVWWLNRRGLLLVLLVGIVAAPFLRHELGNLGAYVFPFTRADSILLGGVIALLVRTPGAWGLVRRYRSVVWAVLGVAAVGLAVLMVKQAGVGDVYLHFVLAVFYGAMVILSLLISGSPLNAFLCNRALVWLGLRSYGIYLFHQPVSSLVHGALNGNPAPSYANFSEFGATLVALLAVLVVSELSFRYFEAGFLRFGSRFRAEGR